MSVLPNALLYGDNLDVLRRRVADESVDLVYLDPPFNSNRNYNVIFARNASSADTAQIQAFDDTWRWTQATEEQFIELVSGGIPGQVADALQAMRLLLGENDALAYLVNMAPRLVELHRVLKGTGSLYLHCDPTASHYLKVLLDAIFGATCFRNEIVWKRYGSHNDVGQGSRHYGRVHDVIFFYTKDPNTLTWNQIFTPLTGEAIERDYRMQEADGRRFTTRPMTGPGGEAKGNPVFEWNGHTRAWRYSKETFQKLHDDGRIYYSKTGYPRQKLYLDESRGVPVQDVWTDIKPLVGDIAERLGYPTQKPVALLERILAASSQPDDVVLDPFCGCGTTIDAAIKLGRRWIGIDITYIAVGLIQARLKDTYGDDVRKTYKVEGIPRDLPGAQALFDSSPFDFERWAVTLAEGTPNQKQVGDRGMDGVIRFPNDAKGKAAAGRVLVSVKGGRSVNPSMVRDLLGVVETQKAEMGLLITMASPTPGMREAVDRSGSYTWPVNGQSFPRIQVITVAELLNFKRPKMPPPLTPYISAVRRLNVKPEQASIFDDFEEQ